MKDMFTLPDSLAHSSHPPDCINASVFSGHILEWIIQFHLKQNSVPANSLLLGPVPLNSRWKVVLAPFALSSPPCHCSSFYIHNHVPILSSYIYSMQFASSGFWYEKTTFYKAATQPSHYCCPLNQNNAKRHIHTPPPLKHTYTCVRISGTLHGVQSLKAKCYDVVQVWPERSSTEKYGCNYSAFLGFEARD